jgi:serine/threonine-protein kinase
MSGTLATGPFPEGDASRDGVHLEMTTTSAGSTDSRLDVTATAPGAPRKRAPSDADLSKGIAHLGRYLLLHKIGQGGMGTVYAAYDPGLDRKVALKLLSRDYTSHAWLLREGQALGRLSHPHVVGIHEVGEHEGLIFLAMEFVEGSTLGEWLAAKPSALEVIRTFVQAGRGLEAAHLAGLVHRDFKPENVMIGRDGRVRVGDFGIAALADAPLPELTPSERPVPPSPSADALRTPLTRTGAVVGTPAFMSPEQFRGDRATALSDQWSFCVALYQAIYRAPPFTGGEFEALKRSVLNDSPTAPPLLPEAPLWLAPILLRGLARDPSHRFANMGELLAAIERHLPRDPNDDPLLVVRERELLSKIYVVLTTAAALAFLSAEGTRLLLSPVGLIAYPLLGLVIPASVAAARWRYLSRNRYGRTIATIFPTGGLALLIQHLIALKLGLGPSEIITEDLVLYCVFYSVIASTLEVWMIILAAICGAAAALAAWTPEAARWAIAFAGILNVCAMAVRLFLDRYMKPATDGTAPPAYTRISSAPDVQTKR